MSDGLTRELRALIESLRPHTAVAPSLNIKEAAKVLGVCTRTVRRRVHEGTLPAHRTGPGSRAQLRFRREDLDAFFARMSTGGEL